MKIVIDIPEEVYSHTQEYEVGGFNQENDTKLFIAIKNGTPLPENGKIVDMEDDRVFELLRQYVSFGTLCDLIDEMPSVLDKKGEQE